MKNLHRIQVALLVAGHYLLKVKDSIFHPLKDLPVPNFNNQYDSTML